MSFPPGAAGEALDVRIRKPAPADLPAGSLSGEAFEILAQGQASGQELRQFKAPLTIEVAYRGKLPGQLWYYDTLARQWQPMATEWDAEAGLLRTHSDHLTIFDISVQDWETSRAPSVKGFQVSQQSGAATYSYPLWAPPGPGGLQPALSLSYHSQVIDSAIAPETQSSWVGMGWSLETGSIRRNTHADGTATFSLLAGGVSSDMLPDSSGAYHTSQESYWKIEYDADDDRWTAYDKQGSVYRFGRDESLSVDARARSPQCNSNGTVVMKTWTWPLVEVEDIYGQKLAYSYDLSDTKRTTLSAICDEEERTTHLAVYPQYITYPNNRYRVAFVLETRYDYRSEWTLDTAQTYFMHKRLDKIEIQHNSGSAWEVVRSYDLSYEATLFPGWTWEYTHNSHSFGLSRIEEKGLGGAALPATTFSYDDLHLVSASNGYGGKVSFTYESMPWADVDNEEDRQRNYEL